MKKYLVICLIFTISNALNCINEGILSKIDSTNVLTRWQSAGYGAGVNLHIIPIADSIVNVTIQSENIRCVI